MARLLLLSVTVLLAACTFTEGFVPPTAQSTYQADVVAMAQKVCAPQGKVAVFYSKAGAAASVPFDNANEAGFDCEAGKPTFVTNSAPVTR
ncbi:MAG TPA: hypothetical protein VMA53_22220 [Stellaceae bacterium]|nr:hypothetical protein [Stellaceae bacterium]